MTTTHTDIDLRPFGPNGTYSVHRYGTRIETIRTHNGQFVTYCSGDRIVADTLDETIDALLAGIAERLTDGAVRGPDGIYRWASSGNIPPAECLVTLDRDDYDRHTTARDADTAKVIAAYRASRGTGPRRATGEEAYELAAAYGPDAAVVDVITGQRIIY